MKKRNDQISPPNKFPDSQQTIPGVEGNKKKKRHKFNHLAIFEKKPDGEEEGICFLGLQFVLSVVVDGFASTDPPICGSFPIKFI